MAPLISHVLAFASLLLVVPLIPTGEGPELAIFGSLIGLAAGAAKRAVGRLARRPARQARRRAARSAAGGAAVGYMAGRGAPPPPPGRSPGRAVSRPRSPAARRAAQLIPFGRTGAPAQIGTLTVRDKRYGFEQPAALEPEYTQRIQCPPGYVAVDLDGDGQNDACVLKGVARAMKMWKARPKPPIKASDWRAMKKADRVRKKAKKIAKTAGFSCKKK